MSGQEQEKRAGEGDKGAKVTEATATATAAEAHVEGNPGGFDPRKEEEPPFLVVWCLDAWHLVFDRVAEALREEEQLRPAERYELRMFDPQRGTLTQQVTRARALVPTTGRVSAEAIDAAADLLLITQPASGLDNVDLEAARKRGIPVCNAPGMNAASVAEAALMSLLLLARRFRELERAFAERKIGHPLGMQLSGKTLGLVGGEGQVGRRLASAARALGMRVLSVGSRSGEEDWETLLTASDAVSLHCPLSAATRHLIDADKLRRMKPGVLLVNFSRGAVVDEAALLRALESGHVGGAALDVFEAEPADPASALASHPRVIAMPHCGVATEEVAEAYAELLVANIVAARQGRLEDLKFRVGEKKT
jgi:phosphoglycerate dehydrogenase-like enzyme